MTGAFRNQANPNGVDLGRVGPSRAGMLTDASFSAGFTYGYSRCPASRDATHSTELTEGGSYLSAYGVSPPAHLAPLRGARLHAQAAIPRCNRVGEVLKQLLGKSEHLDRIPAHHPCVHLRIEFERFVFCDLDGNVTGQVRSHHHPIGPDGRDHPANIVDDARARHRLS